MKYGLIGRKLEHSYSKEILGKFTNIDYKLHEVKPEKLEAFLTKRNFLGINVTIPYKQTVMQYLDVVDPMAEEIGAVNTIVNRDGKLYGYNTDHLGLKALLEKNNVSVAGKKVAILGSGGTSKTAKAVTKQLHAEETLIISRSKDPSYLDLLTTHKDVDIIINTTPCGMYPNHYTRPININRFRGLEALVDVIYNPLRTNIVVEAQNIGIKSIGGLYMLVAQAAYALEQFMDIKVSHQEIERVYDEMMKEKESIILVGMPTSGKTTIGKALAEKLKRPFFDLDDEVMKEKGMTPADIIVYFGEVEFRKIEATTIERLSAITGAVIATGGGTIIDPSNVAALKRNGRLYFIDRSLENLVAAFDRPLTANVQMLKERFNERLPLYKNSADKIIDGDKTTRAIVSEIKRDYK